MLNPLLFARLTKIFGYVKVHNVGIPATFKESQKLSTWGECYAVNCPFCNDRKQHLWIGHLWGQKVGNVYLHPAICYRRNCLSNKRNRELFFQLITNKIQLREIAQDPEVIQRADRISYHDSLREVQEEDPEELLHKFPLLSELSEHHPAAKYIHQRGYDHVELGNKYQLYVCDDPTHPMFARILIPIFTDDRRIYSWTARTYLPSVEPKYIHSRGRSMSSILYNLPEATKYDDFVIVVEGPFDVFRIADAFDNRVVASFGKKISEKQAAIIHRYWQRAYILFDADAIQESAKYARQYDNFYPVHYIAKKDPGEFTAEDVNKILEYINSGSLKEVI